MNNLINLAIQVLPLYRNSKGETYAEIDKAIEIIKASGLKYQVTPFETVIAGGYKETMSVVEQISAELLKTPGADLIINMKLQLSADGDVRMEDKASKYQNN